VQNYVKKISTFDIMLTQVVPVFKTQELQVTTDNEIKLKNQRNSI